MRVWRAHNNQKRKVPKKVMEGSFSGEGALLSAYTPTCARLLRREPSITGRQEQRSTQKPTVAVILFHFHLTKNKTLSVLRTHLVILTKKYRYNTSDTGEIPLPKIWLVTPCNATLATSVGRYCTAIILFLFL